MKAKVPGPGAAAMMRERVAPCGMNCNLCSWVLDPAKPGCRGCRPRGRGCIHKKGLCAKLAGQEVRFCHLCPDFPCENLLLLEQRYRRAHNYSFLENLDLIRRRGMPAFLEREARRYTCPSCGGLLTVHSDRCPGCGNRHPRRDRRRESRQ